MGIPFRLHSTGPSYQTLLAKFKLGPRPTLAFLMLARAWAKFGPTKWPKLGKFEQAKENGIKRKYLIPLLFLVPAIGFELMTYRLQDP